MYTGNIQENFPLDPTWSILKHGWAGCNIWELLMIIISYEFALQILAWNNLHLNLSWSTGLKAIVTSQFVITISHVITSVRNQVSA